MRRDRKIEELERREITRRRRRKIRRIRRRRVLCGRGGMTRSSRGKE